MIKTAVFGGSFDPVHIEHINIAKACVKELGIPTKAIRGLRALLYVCRRSREP